jgi:hypothetical protein
MMAVREARVCEAAYLPQSNNKEENQMNGIANKLSACVQTLLFVVIISLALAGPATAAEKGGGAKDDCAQKMSEGKGPGDGGCRIYAATGVIVPSPYCDCSSGTCSCNLMNSSNPQLTCSSGVLCSNTSANLKCPLANGTCRHTITNGTCDCKCLQP